jgi:hypothetical protein
MNAALKKNRTASSPRDPVDYRYVVEKEGIRKSALACHREVDGEMQSVVIDIRFISRFR